MKLLTRAFGDVLNILKGLPLANRWPYTDGSAGLGTSGESAMLGVTTSRATSGDRKNDPITSGQR